MYKEYTITVVFMVNGKKIVFRNIPFNQAMEMIRGRSGYKLIFGSYQ
jgi:hypothetical protein